VDRAAPPREFGIAQPASYAPRVLTGVPLVLQLTRGSGRIVRLGRIVTDRGIG
jgi:hypothetical protein